MKQPKSSAPGPVGRLWQWLKRLIHQAGGGSEFLCDTCRYDHGNACRRPERPNARRCPEYRRR